MRAEDPDILCIQETKARQEDVSLDLPQYHDCWHAAEKKGYSGTLVLSKTKPLSVTNGIKIAGDEPLLGNALERRLIDGYWAPAWSAPS